MLVLSRIVAGIAVGIATFAVPLYLSEIAPKKHRGTFVSFFQLSLTFGILFAYFINAIYADSFYSWRLMFFAGVVPSLILLCALLPLGDSPRFLLIKGKKDEAERVLEKLNQSQNLDEIVNSIDKSGNAKFERWVFYPLILGIMLMFVQICTGINVIIYYAPTVFQMAGFGSEFAAIITTIGIGIANFLMTFVAIFSVDKFGRKPLVYCGLSIMLLAMTLLGFAFYNAQFFAPYTKIVIFLAILAYICAFSFSLGPVTYILAAELFPLRYRGFLMSVAFGANFIFNFIVLFLFLPLTQRIGNANTFWLFALICVVSLFFYIFFVPETKGYSLEEIEARFRK